MEQVVPTSTVRNRFDLNELAGTFGDIGTPIPFVAACISVVKMDPTGIMQTIGATAVTQTSQMAALTSSAVMRVAVLFGMLAYHASKRGWSQL
jgi:hypothetical protein